jgi:hypothetical protein
VLVTKKVGAKTYELLKLQRLELFGTFEVERKEERSFGFVCDDKEVQVARIRANNYYDVVK